MVVMEALRIVAADFDVKRAGCRTTFVVGKATGVGGGKGRRRRSFVVSGEDIEEGDRIAKFVEEGGRAGDGSGKAMWVNERSECS